MSLQPLVQFSAAFEPFVPFLFSYLRTLFAKQGGTPHSKAQTLFPEAEHPPPTDFLRPGRTPLGLQILLSVRPRGGLALSLGYNNGLACSGVGEAVELAAGPANFDRVGFVMLSQAEGEHEFAG